MNRVIKFRAWDGKGNENTNEPKGCMISMEEWFKRYDYLMPMPYKSGRYEFMQFTGLVDKNKKEIYEGDIITCEAYQREINDVLSKDELCTVTYQEGYFYPFGYNAGWRSGVFNIEVIGNIFENKELIKNHE